MKPLRSISIEKIVLSITLFFFLQEAAFAQSTFSIVTTAPTSITGNITSSPGSTYALTRTSYNGFQPAVLFTVGVPSGLETRNGSVGWNGLPPNFNGIDRFSYDFDIVPAAAAICGIHLRRLAATGGGSSQQQDLIMTWAGGGMALLTDPGNEFTMPTGTLFPSGTVLQFITGIPNHVDATSQWSIDIPASSVSVDCNATANGDNGTDMMWTEWLSFDATCGTILPVELIDFRAEAVENRWVDLTWETASEKDNDYFIIERSVNLEDWEFVAQIDGAGNSTEQLHYSTEDITPYKSVSYYRLTQFDFNGESASSEIRSATIGSLENDNLIIYPNSTSGLISITGSQQQLKEIQLFNSIGQRININVISKTDNTLIIDLTTVASGLYLIHSGHNTYRLIKE